MRLNRRNFLALSALAGAYPLFSEAAETDHGVFWRAQSARYQLTIFGYARVRAADVPDMVRDGKGLIDRTQSLLVDMSPDIKLANADFDRRALSPILPALPEPARTQLRSLLPPSAGQSLIDKLSGFEVSLFLEGEGAQPVTAATPTVGLELVNYGVSLRRPVTTLLSEKDVLGFAHVLSLDTVKSVGPQAILYLLDLRRRVGPIGAYLQNLYRSRQTGELDKVSREIKAHTHFSLSDLVDAERLKALLVERIGMLPAGTSAFLTVPIGIITGPASILDALQAQGAEVSLIG
ncbi:hypothetical protein [Oryzifoliimicrobium ureilyticus]|uniref:hypothetical protein n=1 Tax=Oryzifoliimicrobium ureilyticus TaxID=3113724 RepID=UPI0030763CF9